MVGDTGSTNSTVLLQRSPDGVTKIDVPGASPDMNAQLNAAFDQTSLTKLVENLGNANQLMIDNTTLIVKDLKS